RAAKSRGADPQQALYSALEEADQLQEKNAKDSGAGKPGRNEKQDERGRKGVVPEPTGGPDDSQSVRGIEPWPATSAEERAKGISQMKDQIEEVCQKSGTRLRTTENDHFILYSVLGDGDTRRILALLDSTYATMGQILGFQPNENIFFGKCFVFVFSERFSFLKFENDFFHYPGAEKAGGVCHHVGPYAMLCFYRAPDEQYFLWTLTHEATHAVMYRYKTPAHLPAWANEGLANFIAGQLCTNANQGSEDFQHAHQFAVQNKDPMKVVRQSYENGTWFDDDSYPLSHMMVRYLVRRDQKAFKNWIDDIKAGKAWEVAMLSRFGQPVGKLMEDFSQEMKFEKTYTKITLQAR
ncbi:MAG TPA: collagenase, partial [Phycisphaerales bacterium]|nr:collagenase [Phycisphaerales bacterium]